MVSHVAPPAVALPQLRLLRGAGYGERQLIRKQMMLGGLQHVLDLGDGSGRLAVGLLVVNAAATRTSVHARREWNSGASCVAMYSPFTDMENSGSSHHHRDQAGLGPRRDAGPLARRQAGLRYVLQTPVPVVIVVGTELRGALSQLVPSDATERHAHVMFARYPRDYLGLSRTIGYVHRARTLVGRRGRKRVSSIRARGYCPGFASVE